MATEFTLDLEAELQECRVALQGQAQVMLDLLLQFETRLQARLAAAESRIAALQADVASQSARSPARQAESEARPVGLSDDDYGSHSAAG